jgi:hypothetical protein
MEEKMAAERDSGANIEILIRARYPLIYVVSFEEGRNIVCRGSSLFFSFPASGPHESAAAA